MPFCCTENEGEPEKIAGHAWALSWEALTTTLVHNCYAGNFLTLVLSCGGNTYGDNILMRMLACASRLGGGSRFDSS